MLDIFGNELSPEEVLVRNRGNKEYLASLFPDNKKEYAHVAVGDYHVTRDIHGVTGEVSYGVYTPGGWEKREWYRRSKLETA